ncbi:DUF1998 domain-containing protein, partial [Myxococcota bacterium]|nr:DUF1998 domain-containing protein [Myxococcota bacterium]
LTTLQHALVRGVTTTFQLEDGELLAEPVPSRDARAGFLLYEAAEGGAGVLSRLVSEPGALAAVARRALEILHYAVPDEGPLPDPEQLQDAPDARCVAACYRCLLSYYNQPEHERIDRRPLTVRRLLLRLAAAEVILLRAPPPRATPGAAKDEASGLPAWLRGRGLPAPDHGPMTVAGVALPFAWREYYLVATPTPPPAAVVAALDDLGYALIVLGEPPTTEALDALAAALGAS